MIDGNLIIRENAVVTIHYHLTNQAGDVIDSSEGKDPLAYLHGFGNIIPGLENALLGKAEGDKLTVSVPPEEGYGVFLDELLQEVPRSAFPADHEIEIGQTFTAQGEDGPFQVEVKKITDEIVIVDANHPLAGETLNFSVEVVGIRQASEEELAHGHVHGEGGHHH